MKPRAREPLRGRPASGGALSGLLATGLAFLASTSCSTASESGPPDSRRVVVPVAVAASMREPFEEIAAEFEATHPHADARASYLSSGAAVQQILAGAPFQLFVSADTAYPASLQRAGRTVPGSYLVYARGSLALWLPNRVAREVDIGRHMEADPLSSHAAAPLHPHANGGSLIPESVRRIAIANPDLAPYGRAASEALETMGVSNLAVVHGEDAAQASQIALAAADAALLPISLATLGAMREAGVIVPLPEGMHQPVLHAAVALEGAGENAIALLRFLASDHARAVLARYGFRAP